MTRNELLNYPGLKDIEHLAYMLKRSEEKPFGKAEAKTIIMVMQFFCIVPFLHGFIHDGQFYSEVYMKLIGEKGADA